MHGSNTMATHATNQYFVPHQASYTALLSIGVLAMTSGFVLNVSGSDKLADGSLKHPALAYMATPGKWMMVLGLAVVLFTVFKWLSEVVTESVTGQYKAWEDKSYRIGMIVFICSELAFFAAFFGALFYMRVLSVPDLAAFDPNFTPYKDFLGTWPSQGPGGNVLGTEYKPNPAFHPMSWKGLPLINTILLLSSGATITWAHWGLIKKNRTQLIIGMALTVALGIAFLICQGMEYHHAYTEMGLTLGSGAYGATFFMLTGFHGFHVTLGTIMLIVILLRCMKGHFTPENHFGFEGVAWYWHFVDVVWLGLFIFVYML
jgi:cytochrome c oxidase subunit III